MLEALLAEPDLRRALGENARRWARDHHSVRSRGRRLCGGGGSGGGRRQRAAARAFRRTAAPGVTPPPPLAPYSRDDVDVELLTEVAAALGDLGVTEADEEILRAVAHRVAELGVGR